MKCWPIFEILSQSQFAEICNKAIIKYPTTLKHVATLPCEKLMSEN